MAKPLRQKGGKYYVDNTTPTFAHHTNKLTDRQYFDHHEGDAPEYEGDFAVETTEEDARNFARFSIGLRTPRYD